MTFESFEIARPVRYAFRNFPVEDSNRIAEQSRGFGFLRFGTLEESKAFVERNYPKIYLYGNSPTDNDDETAKVRIAYSRERDDRPRADKADGEWVCKIVRLWLWNFSWFLPNSLKVHIRQLSRPHKVFQVSRNADWYVLC